MGPGVTWSGVGLALGVISELLLDLFGIRSRPANTLRFR